MPTRAQLKILCRTRLKETHALFESGLYDGANYLSGYVIETALKARICKVLDADYPETGDISKAFLTHKFDSLLKLGGLTRQFKAAREADEGLDSNWALLNQWSESLRYNPVNSITREEINGLINALENTENGVLTWLKKKW